MLLGVLLTMGFANQASAQWDEEEGAIISENGYIRYITVGGGLMYETVLDQAVTGIWYQGPGLGLNLGHSKENDRLYTDWDLHARFSRLGYRNDPLLPAQLNHRRYSLDYRALARLNPDAGRRSLRFLLGGMFSGLYDQSEFPHLKHSARAQAYALSLGTSLQLCREIEVYDHPAFLRLDVLFPMFSVVSRTDYLHRQESLDPDYRVFSSFMDRSQAGFWGRYLRLQTRLSYTYVLGNGNRIGLSYQWDYSRIRRDENLFAGVHYLGFHFQFNY